MSNYYKKHKILFGLVILFLALRIFSIGNDITNSDAIRWHRRANNFLTAIKQGELEKTYQHYQPGITLMWLNSIAKQGIQTYQENYSVEIKPLEHAEFYPTIHGLSKTLQILILGALFVFQYVAIARLFNKRTAVFYGFLVATEPYIIGIDRWFHLTSFETFFAFTSFLMLLLWNENKKPENLYLSAIMFALAVYSKLTAVIIALPLLVVFLANRKRKETVKAFFTFVLISVLLFILLLPALWVEPLAVFTKFYNAIVNAIGDDIRTNQLSPIAARFFYFLTLGFKLSPFALFLGIFGLLNIKEFIKHKNLKLILVYFATYFAALMLSDKKIDRYTLAIIPPFLILAAYKLQTLRSLKQVLFLTLSITFTIWIVSIYHPVYSAYYSPVFGGPQNALKIGVFENGGEYFAQAAQYLNNKQEQSLVSVPNNIDSFSYHYSGPTTTVEQDGKYIVWSYDIDRKEKPVYEGCEIEKEFGVTEFTYVYLFNCTNRP